MNANRLFVLIRVYSRLFAPEIFFTPSQGADAQSVLTLCLVLDMVDEVFPIEKRDVMRASEITQNRALLSARDAIHIAIMERQAIRSILSFDSGFDRWPGLRRVHHV